MPSLFQLVTVELLPVMLAPYFSATSSFHSSFCVWRSYISCYTVWSVCRHNLPSVLWHCWLSVRKSIQPIKIEWWDTGGYLSGARCKWFAYGPADATTTRIVSCFIKIQIGSTFLVPAYLGCPGKEAVKWVSVQMENWSEWVFGAWRGGQIEGGITSVHGRCSFTVPNINFSNLLSDNLPLYNLCLYSECPSCCQQRRVGSKTLL